MRSKTNRFRFIKHYFAFETRFFCNNWNPEIEERNGVEWMKRINHPTSNCFWMWSNLTHLQKSLCSHNAYMWCVCAVDSSVHHKNILQAKTYSVLTQAHFSHFIVINVAVGSLLFCVNLLHILLKCIHTLVNTLIILSLSRSISTLFLSYFGHYSISRIDSMATKWKHTHNNHSNNIIETVVIIVFPFLHRSRLCQFTIITLNNLMISCECGAFKHNRIHILRFYSFSDEHTAKERYNTSLCICESWIGEQS